MNNSLISKYIPLNTIIHNLDPRTKIFFVIWYLVDVFIAYSVLEFFILILMLLTIVILSKTSPVFLINSVKAISILILFTSLIHLVFNKKGDVLYEVLGWKIYSGALLGIALITVRFILVVAIMVVFMANTSPTEKTRAIEKKGREYLKAELEKAEAERRLNAFKHRAGWAELPAVKNNRVYAAYHANSRTLSDSASVQFVAKAAYPDLFKDLDPQQTYLNFYKNYLPVTPEGTIYLFPETK